MPTKISTGRRCKCKEHTGNESWHTYSPTSGYQYHGCRCDKCTTGWAAYWKRWYNARPLRGGLPPTERLCARELCGVVFSAKGKTKFCSKECARIVRVSLNKARNKALREAGGETQHSRSGLVRRRRALWERQNGLCALCNLSLPFEEACLDHDHACCDMKAALACGNCDRGAIHNACNSILGYSGDNPDRLMQAVAYLLSNRDVLASIQAG